MNKINLLNGLALALMLSACGGATPHITVVCEENNVGNNIVKWETKPALPGRVQVFASTDPDRRPEGGRPVASAAVADQFVVVTNDNPLQRCYYTLVFDGRYRVQVASRNVNVPGVQNFRDLGGYPVYSNHKRLRWGMLYRSAQMNPADPATLQKLRALRIRTIVDLRDSAERPSAQPLPAGAGLRVVNVPIPVGSLADILDGIDNKRILSDTVGRIVERINRDVVKRHAADFRRLFDVLLDERNYPAVIHCTSGKGRTGIASALVLAALGVDEESIMYDYRLSNTFFDIPLASSYAYQLPPSSQEAITTIYSAREEFLNAAKDEVERRYGTVDNYLTRAIGLKKKELRHLQDILLVDDEGR